MRPKRSNYNGSSLWGYLLYISRGVEVCYIIVMGEKSKNSNADKQVEQPKSQPPQPKPIHQKSETEDYTN